MIVCFLMMGVFLIIILLNRCPHLKKNRCPPHLAQDRNVVEDDGERILLMAYADSRVGISVRWAVVRGVTAVLP